MNWAQPWLWAEARRWPCRTQRDTGADVEALFLHGPCRVWGSRKTFCRPFPAAGPAPGVLIPPLSPAGGTGSPGRGRVSGQASQRGWARVLHGTAGSVTFLFLPGTALVFAISILRGKVLTSWIINGAFLHSPAGRNAGDHLFLK